MTHPAPHGNGQTPDARADKTSRWREITDYLRSDLLNGHYQPGQALPGESALATQYATSRPTIRKAIAQLVSEGLLNVAHGRGTFVRPRPERRLILTGHTPADLLSPNYDPTAQQWELIRPANDDPISDRLYAKPLPMTANATSAQALGIRPGRSIIYRFAFWRHIPTRAVIAVSSEVIADLVGTDHGPKATDERIPDIDTHIQPTDYYTHLERTHGPLRWITATHARMPYAHQAEHLDIAPSGTPVLIIRRTMLSRDGRPLEYTDIEAPADRFEVATTTGTGHDDDLAGLIALRV
ncbi:DNA-binding GntR family transcriptional regulator [Thermocatellispora tengchongensis]|uniref:DNA-binding GntR family transcriptional regulator n=1 Tax=Thermocatellispora tengchongensis TaxID=1073253 RepID=A0A840PG10_9ACTN|nr:GntR family transcriptional regulator [Thermocatellispora tengchongensis]MBB5136883.1 DNA-binding GntR family transcriptional regulator [Thermocatellispora tengchongensis]